ncbi:MAG TPA: hypothetical protein VIH27_02595 [Nitrososphaerales archaeon]
MTKPSVRLPRFSRFEYIYDVLDSISKGKGDRSSIKQALTTRKETFEQLKYKAMGKGKIHKSRKEESNELINDCLGMALKSGLITSNDETLNMPEASAMFSLLPAGESLLKLSDKKGPSSNDFIAKLTEFYITTYPKALEVLLLIAKNEGREINIPDTRHKGHLTADEIEKLLGVRIDAVSMIALRLLLDQSQLTNWFMMDKNSDLTFWKMYLTCNIEKTDGSFKTVLASVQIEPTRAIDITLGENRYKFTVNEVAKDVFQRSLWDEYMKMTDNYGSIPIYYWVLKSAVCYILRISDVRYDDHFKETQFDSNCEYRVRWSSGTIPLSETRGNLIKNLPPKVDNDNYIIYVSLERLKKGH